MIRARLPVRPRLVHKEFDPAGEVIVGGDDEATFTGRDLFTLLEAETTDDADDADRSSTNGSKVGLGRVLDDRYAEGASHSNNSIHVGGIAEQVGDDDRPSAFRDPLCDGLGRDVACERVHVSEDWDGALIQDRSQRPHVRDRSGDDLVAGLWVHRGDRRVDGCRSGRTGSDVPDSDHPTEVLLKSLHGGPFGARERSALERFAQAPDLVVSEAPSGSILVRWKYHRPI